jgi:hypothetical protein
VRGGWELIVVSGMLSVLMQLLFCLRLWIPAIGEPTEGNGFLIPSIFHRVLLTVLDEFLDHTTSCVRSSTFSDSLPRGALLVNCALRDIALSESVSAMTQTRTR